MVTGRMGHISVFCSYAREDEDARQMLEKHLAPLRADKIIDDWYDSRLRPGDRWDDEIRGALENSRLVLFLVTPDLLASRYVTEVEVHHSLERERAGKCEVLPIIVRAAEWMDSPLAEFQALPAKAEPVESFPDVSQAWTQVVAGIRDACKRIVDWENPYKRAQVGDWNHIEQTGRLPDGRAVTVQGTSEIIEKNATQATVLMQMLVEGRPEENTITVDLTEPLENRMGDMMRQFGQNVPANLEVWIGPSRYEEDVLFIGSKRYECVRSTRKMRFEQRGEKLEGTVQQWRCIDVSVDGIVKGTGDMGLWSQHQVLLDFGFGNAATAKPQLFAENFAPNPTAFSPGRWQIRVNAFGQVTEYEVLFYPNGTFQGRQTGIGVFAEVQGQWGFDPYSSLLNLNVFTIVMGMPADQDLIQVQLADAGGFLQGMDAIGRQFMLRRIG